MPDIDALTQVVVDAARAQVFHLRQLYGDPVDDTASPDERDFDCAVRALDEALHPDPLRDAIALLRRAWAVLRDNAWQEHDDISAFLDEHGGGS